ncbi:MAG: hypothetical protein ACOC6G_02555 [Thermoproteota archaeon]
MSEFSEKVHIKESFDVDKVAIEKIPDKELYIIYLPLDSTPDSVWSGCFKREKKTSTYLGGPVHIEGDKLKVTTAEGELKSRIEGLRKLMSATNRCVDRRNEEVRRRKETRKKEIEEVKNRIRKELREQFS